MRRGRPRHPELLTPREQEVLSLIRQGLTNDQIAERLGISESGARYHVSEILSKLGVSSRAAAAWRGDERARVPSAVPPLTRLGEITGQGGGRPLAIAAVAVAAVALVALAVGVVVNETRGGSEGQASAPTPTPGPELSEMLKQQLEADRLAAVIAPDGDLYQMQYIFGRDTERYSFSYTHPDGFVAVHHDLAPQEGEWTLNIVHTEPFSPAPLELSRVVYSPREIYSAAVSAGAAPPIVECDECLLLMLETWSSGSLEWHTIALFPDGDQVGCVVEDGSPFNAMNCGPSVSPWPVPPIPSPTPHPSLAAAGIREMTDLSLRLARIFEPEVHLTSLRAQTSIGGIPTAYWLGFANPDGSTQIVIFRQGGRWEIEIVDVAEPEPQPHLDVGGLQKGADEVAQAAEHDANIHRANMRLLQNDESLVWEVAGTGASASNTTCRLVDTAPLSEIACEVAEATPRPGP